MTPFELPADADPRDKRAWRTGLRARRRAAAGDEAGRQRRAAEGAALREALDAELRLRGVGPTEVVAAFAPTPLEPDLMPWLLAQTSAGRPLLLPVFSGTAELSWVRWDGAGDLDASPARGFGDEPVGERLGPTALTQVAAVVAPALAVDRSGVRLGHGGGFYDRALGLRPAGAPVLVVVHPEEVLPAGTLPRDAHDAPFDAVVTAAGTVLPGSGTGADGGSGSEPDPSSEEECARSRRDGGPAS
jgi:5-formyltetrahydrofolate cyclo-ligase